jgi:hypothetical protein
VGLLKNRFLAYPNSFTACKEKVFCLQATDLSLRIARIFRRTNMIDIGLTLDSDTDCHYLDVDSKFMTSRH